MKDNINTYISQIAFSVTDLKKSSRFYRNVFGLYYSGRSSAPRKELPVFLQGLPAGTASKVQWLQDDSSEFQLEFFQFNNHTSCTPKDWKISDIGMSRIAVEVADLEITLARAEKNGALQIQKSLWLDDGKYAIIRDPDGIMIEVKEDKSKINGKCQTNLCGVSYSVKDFETFTKNFRDNHLLKEKQEPYVNKDMLFGLSETKKKVTVFDGGKIWVEVAQYILPEPKPMREGYMLSDIGLSHIALSVKDSEEYLDWFYNYVVKAFKPTSPKPSGEETETHDNLCMYTRDKSGFVFEILYMNEYQRGLWGYKKPTISQWFICRYFDLIGM